MNCEDIAYRLVDVVMAEVDRLKAEGVRVTNGHIHTVAIHLMADAISQETDPILRINLVCDLATSLSQQVETFMAMPAEARLQ